jgi:guanylate kinase
MSEARKEISHYSEYDFLIINKDIEESLDKIKSILFSERIRRHRLVGIDKFVEILT